MSAVEPGQVRRWTGGPSETIGRLMIVMRDGTSEWPNVAEAESGQLMAVRVDHLVANSVAIDDGDFVTMVLAETVRLAEQVVSLHSAVADAIALIERGYPRTARDQLRAALPSSPTPEVPPSPRLQSDTPSPERVADGAPGDGGLCISTFSDPPFTHRCAEVRLHYGPHRSSDGTIWAWS